MAGKVTVTSTSDNKEQVDAALAHGEPKPKEGEATTEGAEGEGAEGEADPAATEEDPAATGDDEGEEADGDADAEGAGDDDASAAKPEAKGTKKPEAKPKPRRRGARKETAEERIGYLTWQANEARRRAEEAEAKLAARDAAPKPEDKPKEFDKPRPKIDDFATLEEFQEARDNWLIERTQFDTIAEIEKRQGNVIKPEDLRAQEIQRAHLSRLATYREAHPDFQAAIDAADAAQLPLSPVMSSHITHSELGPALLHYLALNEEEATRIASMHPGPALVALGRLEAKVESQQNGNGNGQGNVAPPKPKPKQQQPPPPPPETVGGRTGNSGRSLRDENLSFKEHKALRNRGVSR